MNRCGRFLAVYTSFVLGTVVMTGVAMADGKAWTGAVDSAWETDGNWDPTGVPGTDDAVTIESGTVNVKDKLTVGSLTIGAVASALAHFAEMRPRQVSQSKKGSTNEQAR